MDGDARGGAALSIFGVTRAPIKFVGTGEKLDALEPFHPDRMAGRILQQGDVLSLVEKAQESVNEEDAKRRARKATSKKGLDSTTSDRDAPEQSWGAQTCSAGSRVNAAMLKNANVDDNRLGTSSDRPFDDEAERAIRV